MNIEELLIQILNIINVYLKLILTSWPAVILLLSSYIFFRYKEEIRGFIKRLKSIGPHGADSFPPLFKEKSVPKEEREDIQTETAITENRIALVGCKIASALSGTITFDFLRDWKVWFWIANREPKKYRAYVKIKFITEEYERELNEGYYGGITAWNLNAFSGIQAPGLAIPEEIRVAAEQRKKIKIEINCTVKDENDHLVEQKLPSAYAYSYVGKYWYLEP
ncbi:hypothetical protein KKF60_01380 [Patescibacteria group bacterium]|nr:hypothetical protein [Patescibacteria group bacterium]MBU4458537.1 hypothetical protein [Patescibacteria group bacterium]